MTAAVFDLLEARRMRNPAAHTPEELAAINTQRRLREFAAPDVIADACADAVQFLNMGEQMQRAIDKAVSTARAKMTLRTHYTAPQPPSAA